jgi:hypothetical protein
LTRLGFGQTNPRYPAVFLLEVPGISTQRTLPLPPIYPGEDKDPQMTYVFAPDPSLALYENVEVDEGGLAVLLLYLEMVQEALGENVAQYYSNLAFEITVRDEIAVCKSYMKALERV